MLMRSACRFLSASAAGAGSSSSAAGSDMGSVVAAAPSFAGASGGGVAQPVMYKNVIRATACPTRLITETNSQNIYVRLFQAVTQSVEFIQIAGWTDADTVIGLVIDHDSLNA